MTKGYRPPLSSTAPLTWRERVVDAATLLTQCLVTLGLLAVTTGLMLPAVFFGVRGLLTHGWPRVLLDFLVIGFSLLSLGFGVLLARAMFRVMARRPALREGLRQMGEELDKVLAPHDNDA